jgi:hypothetical protein
MSSPSADTNILFIGRAGSELNWTALVDSRLGAVRRELPSDLGVVERLVDAIQCEVGTRLAMFHAAPNDVTRR